MIQIAIIGGTGVYDPKMLTNIRDKELLTPYGEVDFKIGDYHGKTIAFIPRHGSKHSIPPHLINYRANIWAMKKIGVRNIIATTAVGSLNLAMKPGQLVVIDQFLDFTKSRKHTFYEGGDKGVVHVDVTNPYCSILRHKILEAGQKVGINMHANGTYVCTEGPRFESAAEIKMYSTLGGHVVGMTNIPEVVLAREAEMCYATISMVTNYGAGISATSLTHSEVLEAMGQHGDNIKKIIMETIDMLEPEQECSCQKALAEFGGFLL